MGGYVGMDVCAGAVVDMGASRGMGVGADVYIGMNVIKITTLVLPSPLPVTVTKTIMAHLNPVFEYPNV